MKLEKYHVIKGKILCLEGLKIGGTKEATVIGETDNPIIRHPISRLPYIPGSSIKGKIRSLLEMKYSKNSQTSGRPCDCGDCDICRMFGSSNIKTTKEPGRLIFRDCQLTDDSQKLLTEHLPGSFVEVKTEISSNRKTGATQHGSLRTQERIPEGTEFEFEMSIRYFDSDAIHFKNIVTKLAEGVELLEKDYLGGCGSRGYGKVRFMTPDGAKSLSAYLKELAQNG